LGDLSVESCFFLPDDSTKQKLALNQYIYIYLFNIYIYTYIHVYQYTNETWDSNDDNWLKPIIVAECRKLVVFLPSKGPGANPENVPQNTNSGTGYPDPDPKSNQISYTWKFSRNHLLPAQQFSA